MRTTWMLVVAAVLLLMLPIAQAHDEGARTHNLTLYFFWSDSCPHCAKAEPFLADLEERYDRVEVRSFELSHNEQNQKLFRDLGEALGHRVSGVPAIFIGEAPIVGFASAATTGATIEEEVRRCLRDGCPDTFELAFGEEPLTNSSEDPTNQSVNETADRIMADVPLIGRIDAATISLPALTIILGAADSFNPCAFFVLLFLLSMLVHARSRTRMLLIGGTFIFFSGLIYLLFMSMVLVFFWALGNQWIITFIAGLVALAIAIINIKDFFWFKRGVSLTMGDASRRKVIDRVRGLLRADNLWVMLGGTVILAITVNLYELLCTAGLPMVYTRVLTLHELSRAAYFGYLLLYNIVYIIPLLIIVAIFTLTLGAKRLSEWQGRALKLVSGCMMLALGLVLLTEPGLLNNVVASISIIIGSIVAAIILALLYKTMRGGTNGR